MAVTGTDRTLRLGALVAALVLGLGAFLFRYSLPPDVRGIMGILCFIAIVAACSTNLRAVNWRTVA